MDVENAKSLINSFNAYYIQFDMTCRALLFTIDQLKAQQENILHFQLTQNPSNGILRSPNKNNFIEKQWFREAMLFKVFFDHLYETYETDEHLHGSVLRKVLRRLKDSGGRIEATISPDFSDINEIVAEKYPNVPRFGNNVSIRQLALYIRLLFYAEFKDVTGLDTTTTESSNNPTSVYHDANGNELPAFSLYPQYAVKL